MRFRVRIRRRVEQVQQFGNVEACTVGRGAVETGPSFGVAGLERGEFVGGAHLVEFERIVVNAVAETSAPEIGDDGPAAGANVVDVCAPVEKLAGDGWLSGLEGYLKRAAVDIVSTVIVDNGIEQECIRLPSTKCCVGIRLVLKEHLHHIW